MIGLVRRCGFAAILIAGFALFAAQASASAVRGLVDKPPHFIAVAKFGSPLLPGKVTLLSTDARRVLLSVSSVKILPVLVERRAEPQIRESFRDNALLQEVAPYLWFVAALFILILMARRDVRKAAIPAPRPRSKPGPWPRPPRRA